MQNAMPEAAGQTIIVLQHALMRKISLLPLLLPIAALLIAVPHKKHVLIVLPSHAEKRSAMPQSIGKGHVQTPANMTHAFPAYLRVHAHLGIMTRTKKQRMDANTNVIHQTMALRYATEKIMIAMVTLMRMFHPVNVREENNLSLKRATPLMMIVTE